MAQQQSEQHADVLQSSGNSSPIAEASLMAHQEIYATPAKPATDSSKDTTGDSSTGSGSSSKTSNDTLSPMDNGTNGGSDKTFLSPAEQSARQLRGVFQSAEMGIPDVEHGLSAQMMLHDGAHFEYQPGERADGLTNASRRLFDGGQHLSKTFSGRDDNLINETRFDSKTENSIGRQYETGRGPGGLTEEVYKKTADTEESWRNYSNRGDGLSAENYSNAKGVKQYERMFEEGKGPDGLVRDAKVRTADGSVNIELRKYDPKINKNGLSSESVAKEGDGKVTTRTFEGRADGLVSENVTLAKGQEVSQKVFANGETQIIRGDNKAPQGERETPQGERKIDVNVRLDEIKKATSGPVTAEKADVVRRQLQNLSPEEIQLVKRGFDAENPDALGQHIKESFNKLPGGLDQHAHRWAEVDGNLKRTGAPGEEAAISLKVGALESQQAGTSGNRTLEAIQADTRRTLLGSSEQQRKGIDESLKKLYGDQNGGLKELYESGPGKTVKGNDQSFNASVIDLGSRKGVDARTPQEQGDLLRKAHVSGDVNNFREVAGKDSITEEGRKNFIDNDGLKAIDSQVKRGRTTSEVYSPLEKQELKDLAKFGQENPLTQFKKGIGTVKNTDDALTGATKRVGADEHMKGMYLEGKELAKSGKAPETESQKQSSEFYKDWQKAFDQAHILNKGERIKEYERNITGGEPQKELKGAIASSKDQKGIVSALKDATPQEKERLKSDPEYQKEISEGISKSTLNPASRAASNLILDRHVAGKELSQSDNTMLGALDKVANGDQSPHSAQREVTRAIRDALKQDKDGSVSKELLGDESFKKNISGVIGGERRFNSLVKPLLETGNIPEAQAKRIHGAGTPDYFKDTVLDATPQGLKHLASPEGKQEREAILKNLAPDKQKLAEKIIGQGDVKNEDRFRAFDLGIEKEDKTIDLLKNLSPQERSEAVHGYHKSFGGSLKESLLKNVDESNKPAVHLFANENSLTGDQALIGSRKHVTDSTSSWLGRKATQSDASPLNKLSELGVANRESSGRLSPAEVDKHLKDVTEKLKSFDGTKTEIANLITESVITTGALAAAPFSGGTSLSLLAMSARVGTASLTGGLGGSLLKAQLTGDYSKVPGDVLKYGTLTGANFVGAEAVTALSGLGTRVASRTAEKAFADPAIAGLKGVTPEVKDQVTKGLGDLIQKGYTTGGVKDEAVKGLVNGIEGLSPEAQEVLSKSLVSNLGTSVKEVASDSIKNTIVNAGKNARTAGLEGTAAYSGDVAGELARQQAEKGEVDLPSAAQGGINSFLLGTGLRGTGEAFRRHGRHQDVPASSQEVPTTGKEVPTTDKDTIKQPPEASREPATDKTVPRNRLIHEPDNKPEIASSEERTKPLHLDEERTKPLHLEQERTKPLHQEQEKTKPLQQVDEQKPVDSSTERARVLDKSVPPREFVHEGKAEVDKVDYNVRDYKVGNDKLRLTEAGGWFYGKQLESGTINPLKVHVTTDGAKDLGRVQEALIPELMNDPFLRDNVASWKTHDPLHGVGRGSESGFVAPKEEGQEAKAFTLFLKDSAKAAEVQQRVDEILSKKGLDLPKPHDTKNVDFVHGKSNRVGIVRDSFDVTEHASGEKGAKLDADLESAIRKSYGVREGRQLSNEQLRAAEEKGGIAPGTLDHDKNGNLMLRTTKHTTPYPAAGENKIYIREAGANNDEGSRVNRPAYYSLSRRFGVEPTDALSGRDKLNQGRTS